MRKNCKRVFIIFIILIQLTLIQSSAYLKDSPVRREYFKYLARVVNYIRHQTGWNSMENEFLNWDSENVISVKELLTFEIDENNFSCIFSHIVSVFNSQYIGILLTFVEHVNILIEECEKYLTAQLFGNFINCTTLLEIGMKKSTVMFDSIYQVMWFLSYLDIKRVFVRIVGNPYTVVDEVYLVKHFIDSIQIKDKTGPANNQEEYNAKVNEAILVIFNTKELIKNVTKRAISVLNRNRKLLIIPQRPDLKLNYEWIYHSQEFIENDFFNLVLNNLNKFYTHTKKMYYDDFNFDILLYPIAHSMDWLIPPQEEPLPLSTEVATLKILVDEGKWKTVDHISIIHNSLVISANRIVRDPVSTMHGFNLKKQYILQLLNCRFFEIFSNYYFYLTPILQFCNNKKQNMNCIKNIFDTNENSEHFFNKIYSVVKKLKDTSIWKVTSVRISLSFIEKLLELVIRTFKENYLYEALFNNKLKIDYMTKVNLYLKNMSKQKSILNQHLYFKMKCQRRCIFIGKSNPFISNTKETALENNYIKKINTIDDHLNACIELSTFCKNFIDIDFKDMGFDKIF
ncbi:uncharacterized protein LOC126906671 [Daktulosphaira vitifoliae]|uniref:uncharacterized protein LOC126906671 n=1 Tax=Daktulosphaira vitifoliae TaxID=58002 RepID=UPI0021A9EC47|nr:uncharacterized protein LOC126906671 [Daktulosphaira vitifoliae]